MTKEEKKSYDREYYVRNKLKRQQQMDAWEAAHPGNKVLRCKRAYQQRKQNSAHV